MTGRRVAVLAAVGVLGLTVLGGATAIAVSVLRHDSVARADDAVLARPDHPVSSPSGAYRLEVVAGEDRAGNPVHRFRIRDRDGRVVHDEPTEYSSRHATMFLWADGTDEVWVYSGDVGTSYWDRAATGAWQRYSYAEHRGQVRPPAYLVRTRPQVFGG